MKNHPFTRFLKHSCKHSCWLQKLASIMSLSWSSISWIYLVPVEASAATRTSTSCNDNCIGVPVQVGDQYQPSSTLRFPKTFFRSLDTSNCSLQLFKVNYSILPTAISSDFSPTKQLFTKTVFLCSQENNINNCWFHNKPVSC